MARYINGIKQTDPDPVKPSEAPKRTTRKDILQVLSGSLEWLKAWEIHRGLPQDKRLITSVTNVNTTLRRMVDKGLIERRYINEFHPEYRITLTE